MERRSAGSLLKNILIAIGALAFGWLVLIALAKNPTENCWMSAANAGFEYGESDLRVRWWPPGTECIGPDGTRLN